MSGPFFLLIYTYKKALKFDSKECSPKQAKKNGPDI